MELRFRDKFREDQRSYWQRMSCGTFKLENNAYKKLLMHEFSCDSTSVDIVDLTMTSRLLVDRPSGTMQRDIWIHHFISN